MPHRRYPRKHDDSPVLATRSNTVTYPLIVAAGLVASVVAARVLSLREFALYAVAISLRGTMQLLADLGAGSAAARVFAELNVMGGRHQALVLFRRLMTIRLAIVAVFGLALAVLPHELSTVLGLTRSERYFLFFVAAIAVTEALAVLGYYVLTAVYAQRLINRVTLGASCVQPAVIVLSAGLGIGLPGVLAAVMAASLVRATFLTGGALRRLRAFEDSGRPVMRLGRTYATVTAASMVGKASAWLHSRQFLTLLGAATQPRAAVASFALAYDSSQQVLMAAMAPTNGVALPLFSSKATAPGELRQTFRAVTRATSLLALPTAGLLLALMPSAIPVIFGEKFTGAIPYGYILIPGLALELALGSPITSFMLAQDRLLRPYMIVKGLTLGAGVLYLALMHLALIALVGVMVGCRLGSTAALHLVVRRRTGTTLDATHFGETMLMTTAGWLAGWTASTVVPGRIVDLVAVPFVVGLVYLTAIRHTGVLRSDDAELAVRVFPPARRVLELIRGMPVASARPS
jgi:O-antigen/teichoic acid export membrane protein